MTLLERIERLEKLVGVDRIKPNLSNGAGVSHRVWLQKDLLPDTILGEYEAGDSSLKIALRHDVHAGAVRIRLRELGVKVFRRGRAYEQGKLTKEQIAWVLEQDLKGMSHADIGREVGVTRERIRQICLKGEHPTRRSRMTKVLEFREQMEARKLNKQKMIEVVAAAYAGGASLKEICEMTGREYMNPHQAYSVIQHYRKLRPELFPHKMLRHWKFMTLEERKAKQEKMSQMWKAGESVTDIARQCDFKNYSSAYMSIRQLQKRLPAMFPARGRKAEVSQ